jgi:hypothetical protein
MEILKNMKTKLNYDETIRKMDDLTSNRKMSMSEAAREIFANYQAYGRRGRPFSTAHSIAATVAASRQRLLKQPRVVATRRTRRTSGDAFKFQVRNVMALPGLSENEKFKVIRAMVEA